MLTNATIRYLENELRYYHKNRETLEELHEEIEESSPGPPDGMPRGNSTSNPTESKAIRLISSRTIIYLERRLNAIERVIDRYRGNEGMTNLIRMMYLENTHTAFGVCKVLHISQKTFYRWRRELMEDLANELGL
jgi:RinA family phage transcriptional activator